MLYSLHQSCCFLKNHDKSFLPIQLLFDVDKIVNILNSHNRFLSELLPWLPVYIYLKKILKVYHWTVWYVFFEMGLFIHLRQTWTSLYFFFLQTKCLFPLIIVFLIIFFIYFIDRIIMGPTSPYLSN